MILANKLLSKDYVRSIRFLFLIPFSLFLFASAHAAADAVRVDSDTSDPMFLTRAGDLLSNSSMSFGRDVLLARQKFTYGLNGRLALSADIKYQQNFNGPEDGFSNIGLGGVYRLSDGAGDSSIITDALLGVSFGGSKRVREPEFADTIYQAGVRAGRRWSWLTLSGTVKTSWIFDENRGMAYIDIVPEIYFRMTDSWKAGLGFDLRKSTNPRFDQETASFELVRQYGRTQYAGHLDYEFEGDSWRFGANINILF
jgi:hypothetical protein